MRAIDVIAGAVARVESAKQSGLLPTEIVQRSLDVDDLADACSRKDCTVDIHMADGEHGVDFWFQGVGFSVLPLFNGIEVHGSDNDLAEALEAALLKEVPASCEWAGYPATKQQAETGSPPVAP